jgi:hypothetical protein
MVGGTPAGPTSPDPNNPSGPDIAADPQFDGQMSITVNGTNLTGAIAVFIGGPSRPGATGGWEPCRTFSVTETSCLILPHLSLKGDYQAILATKDQASDPFPFTVI